MSRLNLLKIQTVDKTNLTCYSILELMIQEHGCEAVLAAVAEIKAAPAGNTEAIQKLGRFRNDPRKSEEI